MAQHGPNLTHHKQTWSQQALENIGRNLHFTNLSNEHESQYLIDLRFHYQRSSLLIFMRLLVLISIANY